MSHHTNFTHLALDHIKFVLALDSSNIQSCPNIVGPDLFLSKKIKIKNVQELISWTEIDVQQIYNAL